MVAIINLVWLEVDDVNAAESTVVSKRMIYCNPKVDRVCAKSGAIDVGHGLCPSNAKGAVSDVSGINETLFVNGLQCGVQFVIFGKSNMRESRILVVI